VRRIIISTCLWATCLWLVGPRPALPAEAPDTVFLEELTWTEVRSALQAGKSTIIFPAGGTEQSGPHMPLGKHNVIARYAAEQIARRLGHALVAPVLAYVPEGDVKPPTGHMRFPGTITLPEPHYEKVVEYAARSFRASGFRDIVLLGDSGGNQKGLKPVAERLNREWAGSGARVHFAPDYYTSGYDPAGSFARWLRSQGKTPADIGTHAGIADTSQLMAIDPRLVRADKLAPGGSYAATGVDGDPTRASAAYGKKGLELRIEAAVSQIERLLGRRRP